MDNQLGYAMEGKVAIVTGVGKIGSIGYAISKKLGEEGARLLITDRYEQGLLQIEQEFKTNQFEVQAISGDLSKEETANQLVKAAMESWGRIDIVVNNAGGGIILPFLEHTPATLKETIDRNLWTTVWMCRAVLPVMKEQKRGKIVNIGAESVRNGLWDHAGYNAAKGGVHGLTTGLAREFAPYNIFVNTVAPSGVLTEERVNQVGDEIHSDRVVGLIPTGRRAKISEVSNVVAFMCSDKSDFITGQVISVNGGSSML